jgi:hypothetical protein
MANAAPSKVEITANGTQYDKANYRFDSCPDYKNKKL